MKALVLFRGKDATEYDIDRVLASIKDLLENAPLGDFNIEIRRRDGAVTFNIYPTIKTLWRAWRRRHKRTGEPDEHR